MIIAAGLSSRMRKFKPLLEYDGKSFLINIVDKLLTVSSNVVVVTGFNSIKIEETLIKYDSKIVRCINNSDYNKGMFKSLQKGILELRDARWILYHHIDQPNLPSEFYSECRAQIKNEYDWIQPTYNNMKGHPILLGKKIISKILEASDNSNLRIVSNAIDISKKYWDCNYDQIFSDIDTQADYLQLNKE